MNLQTMERQTMHPRTLWDNSPELRESIRDELYNWAAASRGGRPRLGYPGISPFTLEPQAGSPPFDVERAQDVEDAMTMLKRIAYKVDDADSLTINRCVRALKLHFLAQHPAEASAHLMKISKSHYYRVLGDAMYRVWMILR